MSTTSTDESLPSAAGSGQPKPLGHVHPVLQQVDSPVDSVASLRQYLDSDDPLLNWQRASPNYEDFTSWFPCDDQVAFYTPAVNAPEDCHDKKYDSLTYQELHHQLEQCPSFGTSPGVRRVAIIIPVDQMADMAMALLSVIAQGGVAVPLDPRMPTKRILEAMQQLECTCLVATESILIEREMLQKMAPTEVSNIASATMDGPDSSPYTTHPSLVVGHNRNEDSSCASYFCNELDEIRVVTGGGLCGRIAWTCLSRPNNASTDRSNNDCTETHANAATTDDMWLPLIKEEEPDHKQKPVSEPVPSSTSFFDSVFGAISNVNNAADTGSTSDKNNCAWKSTGTADGADIAMLLRTSGTTNKPKVVPITYSMLLYGAVSIAAALQLKRKDCNANTMPFYHIGGISCNLLAVLVSGGSVLLAGPLQDPNVFLDHLLLQGRGDTRRSVHSTLMPSPTWYYAGPSMHKAIVLMAEARWVANQKQALPNCLRFIRSASAHLNHDLALQLSTVFACQVIPTYGMSEAMPICSSAPIDVHNDPPCEIIDSVGYPTGTSVRIANPDTDQVLEYGSDDLSTEENGCGKEGPLIGEICVKGPGVISEYVGLDVTKTHTPDGWLRTGDHGILDRQGRLFIKGRSKEMIKRGGEQVWPNEIDDVVEKVPGVATAVAFGVPNELWGEEVAVAVVLCDAAQKDNPDYIIQLTDQILNTCRSNLDELSMPQQIKFLNSTEELLRGSTGKYIRSKMAIHLEIAAVDTGALRVLTSVSQLQECQDMEVAKDGVLSKAETEPRQWGWILDLLETKGTEGHRVIPSDALNGVRFLVACFVVHVHVGLFPNLTWVKLQGYAPNMMIFFSLAGFQTTCQVARSVRGQWSHFVGTKIGALHSLFVISQLITFPSYVLFYAFDEDGNLTWNAKDWTWVIIRFIFSTATGLGHSKDVNMFAWFQSTFYLFLVIFPFLDEYLRQLTLKRQGIFLVVFGILSGALWGILYLAVPSDIFFEHFYPIGWSIISWLPLLVTSMLMAYLFLRLVEYYWKKVKEQEVVASDSEMQSGEDNSGTISVTQLKSQTKLWGVVCDLCSFVLLVLWILVAMVPNCLCVYGDTFEAMRPGVEVPEEGCRMKNGLDDYVYTCGVTYEEFVDHIQPDPNHNELGRFVTNFSGGMGYVRIPAPLFALWVASMAFGQGYTARFFGSKLMTTLAPLGYPVYLMQMAVARYYWLATRGLERQDWWGKEGEYPFPVEWYEFFLILLTFAINLLGQQ